MVAASYAAQPACTLACAASAHCSRGSASEKTLARRRRLKYCAHDAHPQRAAEAEESAEAEHLLLESARHAAAVMHASAVHTARFAGSRRRRGFADPQNFGVEKLGVQTLTMCQTLAPLEVEIHTPHFAWERRNSASIAMRSVTKLIVERRPLTEPKHPRSPVIDLGG